MSNLDNYTIYARYVPVIEVAAAARAKALDDMKNDEGAGEWLAEIGSERAMSGSLTPMDDARRIYVFERVRNALHNFANMAPAHSEAADEFINGMPL